MRKTIKNRKGFTLIEMVLVIAIIIIIASVMLIGVGTYVNAAHSAANSVSGHNESLFELSRSYTLT